MKHPRASQRLRELQRVRDGVVDRADRGGRAAGDQRRQLSRVDAVERAEDVRRPPRTRTVATVAVAVQRRQHPGRARGRRVARARVAAREDVREVGVRAQKNRVRGFDDATLAFRRPNPLAQAPRRALVIVEDSRDGVRAAKRVLDRGRLRGRADVGVQKRGADRSTALREDDVLHLTAQRDAGDDDAGIVVVRENVARGSRERVDPLVRVLLDRAGVSARARRPGRVRRRRRRERPAGRREQRGFQRGRADVDREHAPRRVVVVVVGIAREDRGRGGRDGAAARGRRASSGREEGRSRGRRGRGDARAVHRGLTLTSRTSPRGGDEQKT